LRITRKVYSQNVIWMRRQEVQTRILEEVKRKLETIKTKSICKS